MGKIERKGKVRLRKKEKEHYIPKMREKRKLTSKLHGEDSGISQKLTSVQLVLEFRALIFPKVFHLPSYKSIFDPEKNFSFFS
jgi:hypothetical protein